MKTGLIIICLSILTATAYSQQQGKFSSMNFAGILSGQSSPAFEFHTINGISLKKWFAGIGLGYDRYRINSYPLYLALRREWGGGRHSLLLGVDGGRNYSEFRPGWYARPGIGWKLSLPALGSALLVDVGYSYKQVIEKRWTVTPCLVPPCLEVPEKYSYQLTRMSFRLGWQF